MSHPEEELVGPHLDEDRILDLLLELLSESELETAGRHLATCPRCEDLLRHRGALLERRRASQALAAGLESTDVPEGTTNQQGESETAGPGRTAAWNGRGAGWKQPAVGLRWLVGTIRRPRYALGLGGGILVAIALLLLTADPNREVPYPSSAEWLPSAGERLNLRNDTGGAPVQDLATALDAYDRRDLPTAIRTLSAVEASGAMETMRLVFLGSALTQAGEYPRAVQILRSSPLQRLPEPWRGESSWTLLVALHGAGEAAAADSLLHVLADQTSAVGARARRLLGRPNS